MYALGKFQLAKDRKLRIKWKDANNHAKSLFQKETSLNMQLAMVAIKF